MDNGNGGCVEEQQPPSKKRKEADDERVQRAALFMIKSQSLSVPQVRNTMCVCGYLCCFIVRGGVKEGGGGCDVLKCPEKVPHFVFHFHPTHTPHSFPPPPNNLFTDTSLSALYILHLHHFIILFFIYILL